VGQQLVRRQIAWLAAVENGLNDVRGEIAEANEPCKIGWADAFPLGECRKIVLDGEIALLDYRGVPHIDDLGTTSPGTRRQ
jgi:hypothetical protein